VAFLWINSFILLFFIHYYAENILLITILLLLRFLCRGVAASCIQLQGALHVGRVFDSLYIPSLIIIKIAGGRLPRQQSHRGNRLILYEVNGREVSCIHDYCLQVVVVVLCLLQGIDTDLCCVSI